jgi:Lon protease-like protein
VAPARRTTGGATPVSEEPTLLPLFPLELVLLPGMPLPLHIFEERYKQMIGGCLEQHRPFGVLLTRDGEARSVGCSASIQKVLERTEDGRMFILTEGRRRFRVEDVDESLDYLQGRIVWLDDGPPAEESLVEEVLGLFRGLMAWHGDPTLASPQEGGSLSFRLARSKMLDLEARQSILELESETERLVAMRDALRRVEPMARSLGGNGKIRAEDRPE